MNYQERPEGKLEFGARVLTDHGTGFLNQGPVPLGLNNRYHIKLDGGGTIILNRGEFKVIDP